MSSASTSRTIKFNVKSGTYTAVIMCPDGDLYQEYAGTPVEPGTITPNFQTMQPILYFVCTSSRVAEGVATPDAIDFYFGNTKITWSGDTSSGTLAGLFRKISPSGQNPYYGLQFLNNIAAAAGFAPVTIKMVAHISYGTQSDEVQAEYPIPIQHSTGSSYRVTIAAGDDPLTDTGGRNFVITRNGGSCILKAMAYQSGSPLTQNLSYVWEKMGTSGWEVLTGKTSQTLTVYSSDITSYGEYRVTVSQSGQAIGSDIQPVMDASDPLDIDPHPSPEDEAISEDTSGNGSVTYTPVVVTRGTSTKAFDTTFYFVVRDAAGNILNASSLGRDKTSETVTRAQCQQAGGDVSITITSKD